MNTWYTVACRYTKEFQDGTLKKVTEKYLLNTVSFTEAEAIIHKEVGAFIRGEFSIPSITKTSYTDIFFYEDSSKWFSLKIVYITEDIDSGKEKKVRNSFLVAANNAKQAYERAEESLKGLMSSHSIHSVNETQILDVFPYQPEENNESTSEKIVDN